jgi:putative thioredoxin
MDVTEATFQTEVLDRSREIPVVVDFWAAWCGPCRQLTPLLERLEAEAQGSWVLVKVNVDENPALAQAFRVQGIPAVHGFKDGRPVAEFVGALPEPNVREWLSQLGPSEAELLVAEASHWEATGDGEAAGDAFRQALSLEPGNPGARAGLARVGLAARSRAASEAEIEARLIADSADIDAVLAMADLEMTRGDVEGAFDRLLGAVRNSVGEEREKARARLVDLLDTLAPDDQRAVAARRSLSLALF